MTLEEKIANAERVLLYYKAYSDYRYAIIEYYARQGKPLKVVSYRVYGEELKSGDELRVYTPYLTSMNFSVVEDNFNTEKEAKLRMKELKETRKMKPIVKWVGGKSQLTQKIKELLPESYNRYYEPFLGGGAVLLDLNPKEAYVNDINSELINMYIQVREDVESVIWHLRIFDHDHDICEDKKAYYYMMRAVFNKYRGEKSTMQAARFIYLNKHCFNGLYRENSKCEFNVPFNGKLTGGSFDAEHLREVSKQIHDVMFLNGDFEDCIYHADKGDLVYFDSPYDESFTDYTGKGFSEFDHRRLADKFKELSDRGCYCMLTNHDTPLIRELYKDYNFTEVDVRRSINRNGDNRKGKEVIITNY